MVPFRSELCSQLSVSSSFFLLCSARKVPATPKQGVYAHRTTTIHTRVLSLVSFRRTHLHCVSCEPVVRSSLLLILHLPGTLPKKNCPSAQKHCATWSSTFALLSSSQIGIKAVGIYTTSRFLALVCSCKCVTSIPQRQRRRDTIASSLNLSKLS